MGKSFPGGNNLKIPKDSWITRTNSFQVSLIDKEDQYLVYQLNMDQANDQ